nr:hypothetical protein HmN_000743300 [Hymenolepis microstoma]
MVPTFKVVSGDFTVDDRRSGGGGEKVVEDGYGIGGDSCQTQEELSKSLDGYQSASNFKTPEAVGDDFSERRILDTPRDILRVETTRCGATFACL